MFRLKWEEAMGALYKTEYLLTNLTPSQIGLTWPASWKQVYV